jgi:hypothetical protein
MREGMQVNVKPAGRRRTMIRRRAKIVTTVAPSNRPHAVIVEYPDGERSSVSIRRVLKRP